MHGLLLNWIYTLCFLGGLVNSVSFLEFSYTVSHFTGYVSKIAIGVGNKDYLQVITLFAIMFFFIAGAIISGLIVDGREFNLKRRYGFTILAIGVTLILLHIFFKKSFIFFYYLPFMVGLQNGLFISYKGVVVRTTHISGSITDLGVYIGHYLKGKKESKWKIYFCLFTILIFFLGSLIGLILSKVFHQKVFIIVGVLYIVVSIIYFHLRYRYRHILHITDENYALL